MKKELTEMRAIQRMRGRFTETWHVIGEEIYTREGEYIGRCRSKDLAVYIVRSHNLYGTLANITWTLYQKRLDKIEMTKEQMIDNINEE